MRGGGAGVREHVVWQAELRFVTETETDSLSLNNPQQAKH